MELQQLDNKTYTMISPYPKARPERHGHGPREIPEHLHHRLVSILPLQAILLTRHLYANAGILDYFKRSAGYHDDERREVIIVATNLPRRKLGGNNIGRAEAAVLPYLPQREHVPKIPTALRRT